MKRYAEVIKTDNLQSGVRIYREKYAQLYPTSITVTVKGNINADVGDLVTVNFNALLFFSLILFAYIIPLIGFFAVVFLCNVFTDNFLITECISLLSLPGIYFASAYIEKLPILKSITLCTIVHEDE